jgi:N-acetyl-1-D-myo-inositol-2-amino-2-deoxy-alpha-D-glucopyranoside deacetylase
MTDRRLLFVHAHPDDEVIQNGVTMAKYARDGVGVTLVTCTLGEEGEVLIPELAHLASSQDDTLGGQRILELTESMQILGVTDHRFLGEPGTYRDTGMATDDQGRAIAPPEIKDGTFWRADLLAAAIDLVAVIREVRPQVVVCDDEYGNYGHPDHIQSNRVTMYASQLAGVPGWRPDLGEPWVVQRNLWSTMSESEFRKMLRDLREQGNTDVFGDIDPEGELPIRATADEFIAARIEALDLVDTKVKAMLAHATQIRPDGPFFSGGGDNTWWGVEHYRLAAGVPMPGGGPADDLFAGLV